jgi:hypothetical protein
MRYADMRTPVKERPGLKEVYSNPARDGLLCAAVGTRITSSRRGASVYCVNLHVIQLGASDNDARSTRIGCKLGDSLEARSSYFRYGFFT